MGAGRARTRSGGDETGTAEVWEWMGQPPSADRPGAAEKGTRSAEGQLAQQTRRPKTCRWGTNADDDGGDDAETHINSDLKHGGVQSSSFWFV